MAIKLPNLNRDVPITNPDGTPTAAFVQWWQLVVNAFNSLSGIVDSIAIAQAAATTAQAAAVVAQTAAVAAQASVDNVSTDFSDFTDAFVGKSFYGYT